MLRFIVGAMLAGLACLQVVGALSTILAIVVPGSRAYSAEPVVSYPFSPSGIPVVQPAEPFGIWNGNPLHRQDSWRPVSDTGLSIPSVSIMGWIVIAAFAFIALRIAFGGRRRQRRPRNEPIESDARTSDEMAKRRREAELVYRMHRVMDRLETRVESLESALLP
jgi:hypothetical protein